MTRKMEIIKLRGKTHDVDDASPPLPLVVTFVKRYTFNNVFFLLGLLSLYLVKVR